MMGASKVKKEKRPQTAEDKAMEEWARQMASRPPTSQSSTQPTNFLAPSGTDILPAHNGLVSS